MVKVTGYWNPFGLAYKQYQLESYIGTGIALLMIYAIYKASKRTTTTNTIDTTGLSHA